MSVVVGAVYWDVRSGPLQQQDNVNNRATFHYVMASLALWPVLLMAISEVWRDKPAVARDVADGLYSKGIYILTKVRMREGFVIGVVVVLCGDCGGFVGVCVVESVMYHFLTYTEL